MIRLDRSTPESCEDRAETLRPREIDNLSGEVMPLGL
jgi:hypothetical protein